MGQTESEGRVCLCFSQLKALLRTRKPAFSPWARPALHFASNSLPLNLFVIKQKNSGPASLAGSEKGCLTETQCWFQLLTFSHFHTSWAIFKIFLFLKMRSSWGTVFQVYNKVIYLCVCVSFFRFFSIICCYKISNIVLCNMSLLSVDFLMYGSRYLLIQNFQCIPSLFLFHFGDHKFVFCVCECVSVL